MTRRTRWLLFLTIIGVAVALRFWRLTSLPPGFYLDESYEGIEAWRILTEPTYRPVFLSVNSGVLPLNAYANALTFGLFRLFGGEAGPLAMRVTAACFGVLGVAALYGLAVEIQQLAKPRLSHAFPFFAAAMLAMMRWHIQFSRIGIEVILAPLLWASALWLLFRGWRTRQWLNFAGCGVMVAACLYAYQAIWIIPLLMIAVALLLLMEDAQTQGRLDLPKENIPFSPLRVVRSQPSHLFGLVVAGVVALLLFLPFGWYIWQHPDILTLRASQAVSLTGTDRDIQPSIARSVRQTALMYLPLPGFGDLNVQHNIPGAPVLNLWQALLFFLGLGLVAWRLRQPVYALLLLSLVGLLLPGAPTKHAPAFHRLLGAAAPTALLCALALDWLWQARPDALVRRRWLAHTRWGRRPLAWVSVLVLLLGGLTATYEYFGQWAALPELYYAFDAGLWQIGRQLAQTPPTMPVYLSPKESSYPTLVFPLLTHHHAAPVSFDGRHIFPLTAQVSAQPELYVIIERSDFRSRLLLPEIFPTATVQQELFDRTGQVYARYYLRPAGAVPQRAPHHPLAVTLGDGIALAGYDVMPTALHRGKILYLQLHWRVQAKPTAAWTVFAHVVARDAAGQQPVVAGHESQPGEESLPTSDWQVGWRILDEYQIALPDNLTPGKYLLQIGLSQANGVHLPPGEPGVDLGKVKIK